MVRIKFQSQNGGTRHHYSHTIVLVTYNLDKQETKVSCIL